MKKMNKKGFTIVELVIVIAVIAILAAVLIPTFTIVVRKANESAAIQALDSARKEYMTVVDATSDDFADYDATYCYHITADKKGQNYDHLAGIWKFENGAWAQKVSNATTGYVPVYEYTKATAYADGTTYYSDINGTEQSIADAAAFTAYVATGTLYTRAVANVQGVEIYKAA